MEMRPRRKNVAFVVGGVGLVFVVLVVLCPRIYGKPKRTDLISHAKHADIECNDCHVDAAKGEELRRGKYHSSMELCLKCHAEQNASQECQLCHLTLRKDEEPLSHAAGFDRDHGMLSETTGAKCAVCHQRNFCQDCHLNEEPQSHTFLWKKKAHGRMAMIDRSSCKTCHRTDFCVDCHSDIWSAAHPGRWFSRPWTSRCRDCHVPSSGCALCDLAGADCTRCHQGI